jgi:hypothetical protein
MRNRLLGQALSLPTFRSFWQAASKSLERIVRENGDHCTILRKVLKSFDSCLGQRDTADCAAMRGSPNVDEYARAASARGIRRIVND